MAVSTASLLYTVSFYPRINAFLLRCRLAVNLYSSSLLVTHPLSSSEFTFCCYNNEEVRTISTTVASCAPHLASASDRYCFYLAYGVACFFHTGSFSSQAYEASGASPFDWRGALGVGALEVGEWVWGLCPQGDGGMGAVA